MYTLHIYFTSIYSIKVTLIFTVEQFHRHKYSLIYIYVYLINLVNFLFNKHFPIENIFVKVYFLVFIQNSFSKIHFLIISQK